MALALSAKAFNVSAPSVWTSLSLTVQICSASQHSEMYLVDIALGESERSSATVRLQRSLVFSTTTYLLTYCKCGDTPRSEIVVFSWHKTH